RSASPSTACTPTSPSACAAPEQLTSIGANQATVLVPVSLLPLPLLAFLVVVLIHRWSSPH
ncbi:hypothetical protein, partial [Escherichia coli]|uniref:hypothetical protein n=1 Tax=Escherichia coli TaxID=562 RepID=UPI003CE50B38